MGGEGGEGGGGRGEGMETKISSSRMDHLG